MFSLSMVMASGSPRFQKLWTPEQLSPAIWLDAASSSTVSTSSNAVTEWRDKSGNVRHYSQSNGANCPTYETAVQNSLNAVRIVNSGSTRQFLDNTSFTYNGNQISIFSVHRNNAGAIGTPSTYGRLFSFAANAENDYDNTNGIILTYGIGGGISLYRNSAEISTTSAINDQWCFVGAERNGTQGRISLNGSSFVSGTTSAANQAISRSRIGNDFSAVDSGMVGWIGEQIVVFGALSDQNWLRLQGYGAHRWGLTANLPANHPYKNLPPYFDSRISLT